VALHSQVLSLLLVAPASARELPPPVSVPSAAAAALASGGAGCVVALLLLPLEGLTLLLLLLLLLLRLCCGFATAWNAALISSGEDVTVTLGSVGSLGSLLAALGCSSGKESGKNSSWMARPAFSIQPTGPHYQHRPARYSTRTIPLT